MLEDIDNDAIGMDCSIIPSQKYNGFYVISTTDFFYPLVNDPYLQGRIGCSNVISDMYALGIADIDNVLMILAASLDMKEEWRDICTKQMIRGFNDCCKLASTDVTGGQSVMNPWPIIGGVAKSICTEKDFISPYDGTIGDCIVLTKPLGTQLAVNVREWKLNKHKYWKSLIETDAIITAQTADSAFNIAVGSMMRLNRNAAQLMHKYNAHGATDVTGFGILGHADNLAEHQSDTGLELYIHTLPIIVGMADVVKGNPRFEAMFRLMEGYSSETSGGLLIMLPGGTDKAQQFCDELQKMDGWPSYIIGEVRELTPTMRDTNSPNKSRAVIAKNVKIIDVKP